MRNHLRLLSFAIVTLSLVSIYVTNKTITGFVISDVSSSYNYLSIIPILSLIIGVLIFYSSAVLEERATSPDRERIDKIRQDRLIDRTLRGDKPGFLEDIDPTKLPQELIAIKCNAGGIENSTLYAISKKGSITKDFIDTSEVYRYSDLPIFNDLVALYDSMKNLSVAESIKKLNEVPSRDYTKKGELRRIAADILEGALLGYKTCCTEYYARTRRFGQPTHDYDPGGNQWHGNDPLPIPSEVEERLGKGATHVYCSECITGKSMRELYPERYDDYPSPTKEI